MMITLSPFSLAGMITLLHKPPARRRVRTVPQDETEPRDHGNSRAVLLDMLHRESDGAQAEYEMLILLSDCPKSGRR